AEDGIRDFHVTGVQTCALPIYVEIRVVPDLFQLNMRQVEVENLDGIPLLGVNGHVAFRRSNRLLKRAIDLTLVLLLSPFALALRSEERRVGKECRSRRTMDAEQ